MLRSGPLTRWHMPSEPRSQRACRPPASISRERRRPPLSGQAREPEMEPFHPDSLAAEALAARPVRTRVVPRGRHAPLVPRITRTAFASEGATDDESKFPRLYFTHIPFEVLRDDLNPLCQWESPYWSCARSGAVRHARPSSPLARRRHPLPHRDRRYPGRAGCPGRTGGA